MRKNSDASRKKPEEKGFLLPALMGSGVALVLVLILVLGVAALIWSGTIPAATPSIALSFCMGLCAFAGGRFAIGKGSAPIITGIATGVVLACAMAVISLAASGSIPFHGGFLALILLILAGGGLSGLFGGKKKRKKNKKK